MADFNPSRRLTHARDFEQVIRRPEIKLSSGPLRIRARKNTLSHPRLGIVVPKRGTALAVHRNRAKRIVREIFRVRSSTLPELDMVVQIFNQMDDQVLRREFEKQLKKLARTGKDQPDAKT